MSEIEDLIERAKKGDAEAQYRLGVKFAHGIGIERDLNKTTELLTLASEQGHPMAQADLALFYLEGIAVEKDIKRGIELLTNATNQEYSPAQEYLGDLYLKGIGVEQDFEKAEELFRKAYKNNNLACEYYVKIFDRLNGRKIKVIRDMSEEVEEGAGAVLIAPEENSYCTPHTLYDIETYRKIKSKINEILEDVEEVHQNKDNEFDVFMKIYIKLGKLIKYDNEAKDNNLPGIMKYISENLIGGLLQGKCVCARICRNIKKCTCM